MTDADYFEKWGDACYGRPMIIDLTTEEVKLLKEMLAERMRGNEAKPKPMTRGESIMHQASEIFILWKCGDADACRQRDKCIRRIVEMIDAEILRERSECRKAVDKLSGFGSINLTDTVLKRDCLAAIDARNEPKKMSLGDAFRQRRQELNEKLNASLGFGKDRCAEIAEKTLQAVIESSSEGGFSTWKPSKEPIADALRSIARECAEMALEMNQVNHDADVRHPNQPTALNDTCQYLSVLIERRFGCRVIDSATGQRPKYGIKV